MSDHPLSIGCPPGPVDQATARWIAPIVEELRDVPLGDPWWLNGPTVDLTPPRTFQLDRPEPGPACRVCGCTEYAACLPPCWWVADPAGQGPLCSACKGK